MSVRIHAIAKETNKTSKEVIELLAERGYEIKSASSTIDNITAQSLIDEFKKEASEVVEVDSPQVEEVKESTEESKAVPFVKTKKDLDREKEDKERAELEAKAALADERETSSEPSPGNRSYLPSLKLQERLQAYLRHQLNKHR
jgi:translation initiation factor IF-2